MILNMLTKRRRSKLVHAIWEGRVEDATGITAQDVSMDVRDRVNVDPGDGRRALDASDNRTNMLLESEIDCALKARSAVYHASGLLSLNAFEAALATGRETLALAIWDLAGDDPTRHQTHSHAQNSALMFAAHLGSAGFLEQLARRCPQREWAYVAMRDGKSAWSVLENRGDVGLTRAVEAGWLDAKLQDAPAARDAVRL